MVDPTYLLSDEQMKEFIVNGFVKLNTELSPQVHQRIYERTEEVFEKEGNPGNNVLPRVPELGAVFEDPAVVGALSSVLGPDYVMHAHRHPHINRGPNEGGGWHKDRPLRPYPSPIAHRSKTLSKGTWYAPCQVRALWLWR